MVGACSVPKPNLDLFAEDRPITAWPVKRSYAQDVDVLTAMGGQPHAQTAMAVDANAAPPPTTASAMPSLRTQTVAVTAPAAGAALPAQAAAMDGLDWSAASSAVFGVHLASYRSVEAAARGWPQIRAAAPDALAAAAARVDTVDLGEDKGVYERLKAGPFPSRADADAACAALKGAGRYCQVTDFAGRSLSGARDAQ